MRVGGLERLVPEEYWEFSKVFEEEVSERMLKRKEWDHGIELKERLW